MIYDAVIVGGGPAGLSAALALGRARKRVLLCDSGPRRNAAAEQVHNFVTRDGTPPDEFRQLGRAQLEPYPSVRVQDARVEGVTGTKGAFELRLSTGTVSARRVVLCTGMVDELLPLEGFRELWGQSIFQCPYCHGWEVQGRRWAYLERALESLHFPVLLRGWTQHVVVLTGGAFEVPVETQERLQAAGIQLEVSRLVRLTRRDGRLASVELSNGETVACDVLFAHPTQRQVELVRELGLELDDEGFVRVDATTRETSMPGVYAAGDSTTRIQSAILAAGSGMHVAAMLNHELTAELAVAGLMA